MARKIVSAAPDLDKVLLVASPHPHRTQSAASSSTSIASKGKDALGIVQDLVSLRLVAPMPFKVSRHPV